MNQERLIAAIRTINQYHNLADAIYAVRSRAVENDPGYTGDAWQHPVVTEYSKAIDTVAEEIGGWGNPKPPIPSLLPCPFCNTAPTMTTIIPRQCAHPV